MNKKTPNGGETEPIYIGALVATFTVYVVLLLTLLWHYASRDGFVWYMALQSIFLGASLLLWHFVDTRSPRPAFTKLSVYHALPVATYTTTGLHVFALGYLTADYERRGALFAWIFPFMFFVASVGIGIHGWLHMTREEAVVDTPPPKPSIFNTPVPTAPPPLYTANFFGW
jgi:hypothetical protein